MAQPLENSYWKWYKVVSITACWPLFSSPSNSTPSLALYRYTISFCSLQHKEAKRWKPGLEWNASSLMNLYKGKAKVMKRRRLKLLQRHARDSNEGLSLSSVEGNPRGEVCLRTGLQATLQHNPVTLLTACLLRAVQTVCNQLWH